MGREYHKFLDKFKMSSMGASHGHDIDLGFAKPTLKYQRRESSFLGLCTLVYVSFCPSTNICERLLSYVGQLHQNCKKELSATNFDLWRLFHRKMIYGMFLVPINLWTEVRVERWNSRNIVNFKRLFVFFAGPLKIIHLWRNGTRKNWKTFFQCL